MNALIPYTKIEPSPLGYRTWTTESVEPHQRYLTLSDEGRISRSPERVWQMRQKGALLTLFLLMQCTNALTANQIRSLHFRLCVDHYSTNPPSYRFAFPRVDSRTTYVSKNPKTSADEQFELETIFNGLAKIWKESTGGLSSTSRRFTHPTYLAILRLGPETIPLILMELQQRPDWWFDALEYLTKPEPPPTKPSDTFQDAALAWIIWGKSRGIIH